MQFLNLDYLQIIIFMCVCPKFFSKKHEGIKKKCTFADDINNQKLEFMLHYSNFKNVFITGLIILFMFAACEDKSNPSAPTGLTVVVENNAVRISWNSVRGADAYRIETSTDNFASIATTTILSPDRVENYFIHAEPVAGVRNYYRVRSIRYGKNDEFFSNWSHVNLNFLRPGGGTEQGLWLGIIGFNNNITTREISLLTRSNIGEFQTFVDRLTIGPATGLYYAVDNAINMLQGAAFPDDLANVSLVTFTDGLDNISIELNQNFNSRDEYRDFLRDRISNDKVGNLPINAFSIGIQGGDVVNVPAFRAGLAALASSPNNVHEVTSMTDVNNIFREIANSLYFESQRHILSLRFPGGFDDGDKIRFTFDLALNVEDATMSNLYIEGVFRRSGTSRWLENIKYEGMRSSSGTRVDGSLDAGFVTFNFENLISIATGNIVSRDFVRQWEYIASESEWQGNSEFDQAGETQIDIETRSAIIMLVLDCTLSLDAGGANGFRLMKNAANDFINELARQL